MSEEYRKSTFTNILLRGLGACVGGLLLIIWPKYLTTLFVQLSGVALMLAGAYGIVMYFVKPLSDRALDGRLTHGLLMILLGLVLLLMSDSFKSLLSALINIALIFCGLERLRMGLYLHKLGLSSGKWVLLSSAIVVAVGILLLVLNPSVLIELTVRLYGVFALVEGCLGVASAFLLRKVTKPVKPIEAEVQ